MWTSDGGQGLYGMRGGCVFIHIGRYGRDFKIIPRFPLPRGSRVIDDLDPDIRRAQVKAEWFFREWMRRVWLTEDKGDAAH